MHTCLTSSPEEAAAVIRGGGIAAFPTETVYGLGADAFNEAAVQAIFDAKGRPQDNPLIVHLARLEQLSSLVATVPDAARVLIRQFFPGPLTLILPKKDTVPAVVTAGLDTVGVRMPRHPVAHAFLQACAIPVAAPSANRSGRPSPTTWQAVHADLNGRIPCILKGDRSEVGVESTVLDGTGPVPVVLRAGAVTLEQLRAVVPEVTLASPDEAAPARSPGRRHRHYAPQARIRLVSHAAVAVASPEAAFIGLHEPPAASAFRAVLVCPGVAQYAHALFHFFRHCDGAGVQTIYCEAVEPVGLGLALMDRLQRAAQG